MERYSVAKGTSERSLNRLPIDAYAQTVIGLQQECLAFGREGLAVACGRAHKLAITLFAGSVRASGKLLLEHLTGTASIALRHGGADDEVIAAQLHAAYTHGDFGLLGGPRPRNRRRVQAAIGESAEGLVFGYARQEWTAERVRAWADPTRGLAGSERSLAFLRICNEREEYLDCGLAYCGETKQGEYHARAERDLIALAEGGGWKELARELCAAIAQNGRANLPPALVNPLRQEATKVWVSASYRQRWRSRFLLALKRI